MVGGQVVDMESEGNHEIDLATVQYIHTHKTGALIKASVVAGALLAGAGGQQLAAITRYGEAAGLAFQIADDILDIEGTTEEIGKDAGSDEARGKATYPAVMGIAAAKEEAQAMMDEAMRTLELFGAEAEPLREIARYIVQRKN
jgi:geranylgeranyl diphosphate synthase type II